MREFAKPKSGSLCTQCNTLVFASWKREVISTPSLNPLEVLDIGANKGDLAVIFLAAFPPPRHVRSYELDPATCANLTARRDSHSNIVDKDRWTVTCEGVAATEGSMDFYSGGANSPLSSLGTFDTLHEHLKHGGKANVTTVEAI